MTWEKRWLTWKLLALILGVFLDLYSLENIVSEYLMYKSDDLIKISHLPLMEEIKQALFDMKPLKPPSPDDFHPIFFQNMWHLLNDNICQMFRNWFRLRILKNLIKALICLFPKIQCLEMIKHLRPSLCHTLYKLVTKIMVDRLKPLLPHWIS